MIPSAIATNTQRVLPSGQNQGILRLLQHAVRPVHALQQALQHRRFRESGFTVALTPLEP